VAENNSIAFVRERTLFLADGSEASGGAYFPTAMCDPHHQLVGYMTVENGWFGLTVAGWPGFQPSVLWMVLSNAARLKGFSRSVTPRFKTSRSAINSPV